MLGLQIKLLTYDTPITKRYSYSIPTHTTFLQLVQLRSERILNCCFQNNHNTLKKKTLHDFKKLLFTQHCFQKPYAQ